MFVKSLDMTRVKEAIKIFEGEHDFVFFKKKRKRRKKRYTSNVQNIYLFAQRALYL